RSRYTWIDRWSDSDRIGWNRTQQTVRLGIGEEEVSVVAGQVERVGEGATGWQRTTEAIRIRLCNRSGRLPPLYVGHARRIPGNKRQKEFVRYAAADELVLTGRVIPDNRGPRGDGRRGRREAASRQRDERRGGDGVRQRWFSQWQTVEGRSLRAR